MYELHGFITHHQDRTDRSRFQDRWITDVFDRETVPTATGTLYVDRYTAAPSTSEPYFSGDDVLVAVEGDLHEVRPAVKRIEPLSIGTASASEVVARAYRTFGWQFPQYLIGDYCFLLIDRTKRRLVAGRDRTLTEAIYYTVANGTTLVSTDLVALAAEVNADVNNAYLGEYLTGDIESPQETFYADVFRIPPGCVLVSSADAAHVKRYYHPQPENRSGYQQLSITELGEILRERLETAIDCRLAASGPTGVFMSGGADSTAIAGLASQRELPQPLHTYSYVFPNTDAINETEGITAAVETYGLDHNEQITVDNHWVLKDKALYEQAWAYSPAVDSLLQPKVKLLQRATADGMETILVGDNGNALDGSRLAIADTLRDGQYREALRAARVDPVYTTIICLLLYGILPNLGIHTSYALPSTSVEQSFRRILTDDILEAIEARRHASQVGNWLQYHHDQAIYRALIAPIAEYRNDIYCKIAKQHGIRLTDPYQDARLMQFVFDLPGTTNLQHGYDKAVFRDGLSDVLPAAILSRQKDDTVEGEEAKGLQREADYLTPLLDISPLKDIGIVREQWSVPDTAIAIQKFKDGDVGIWRVIAAHAWVENQLSGRAKTRRKHLLR
ncbi:asparagine synthase-related protein [Halocatena pleomorpha]|nr:asparagine synthase-related protein [Halocatena pleomorpha]